MLSAAKHLVANLEMRPDNHAARLLLRVSQDGRKYRDRPFAEFTLSEANVLRVTLGDCLNCQGLFFTIEPCVTEHEFCMNNLAMLNSEVFDLAI
jgi:hypothetical protein